MKQITRETMSLFLPKRARQSHKGSFGRVLVVAGSRTMCGAGLLCAKSALTAGAGLVFWALPQSMQPAFAAALPETITLPLPETEDGLLAEKAFPVLRDFINQYRPSLMVVGPGMGIGESSLLVRRLTNVDLPLIIDGDALNALARKDHWIADWLQERPCIFTPHPLEMARLLKTDRAETEEQRISQVETLCRQTEGVSLLKGSGTLVGAKIEDELQLWQNTTGGPALAKAGSGDVLAGVIAGLWAQLGMAEGFTVPSALKAALCGVYLHGLAGDLAALKRTDYCVLASDTADYLAQAFWEVLA